MLISEHEICQMQKHNCWVRSYCHRNRKYIDVLNMHFRNAHGFPLYIIIMMSVHVYFYMPWVSQVVYVANNDIKFLGQTRKLLIVK